MPRNPGLWDTAPLGLANTTSFVVAVKRVEVAYLKEQTRAMLESELRFMRTAIDLGKRSVAEDGRSHPKVGAVLSRNGEVLGEAFRGEMGIGDNAEYSLFEKKLPGIDVRGPTLFTTLEP